MDYVQEFISKKFMESTLNICLIIYSVYNPSFVYLICKI